jgi:uncharacterized membrane protein
MHLMWRRSAAAAAAAALLALVAYARPASAQAFESIRDYGVVMDVRADGVLHIDEMIQYDFGSNSKHGIYRYIPVRFHFDDKYDRVYKMTNIKVTGSPGTPTKVDLSDSNNNKVIRIGDPKKTITGEHRYTVSYDVHGALNAFSDHDELYWNAIGNGFDVPIDNVHVNVHVAAPIKQTACFAGPYGSNVPCPTSTTTDENDVVFRAAELGPSSGVTIVTAFPHGAIAKVGPILDERWTVQRAFAVNAKTVPVAAGLTLLIVGLVGRLMWRRGRDRRLLEDGSKEGVRPMFDKADGPVAYRPPDDLRPAQVGVLIDESADPLDVTATIVDLAVRGFLSIEEIPDKGLFSKGDWRLTKQEKDVEELEPYENRLYSALFRGTDGTALLSDLKNHFYDDLKKIQKQLYQDAVKKKWFLRSPDTTRAMWFGIGIAVFVLGVLVVAAVAATSHAGFAVLPLVLAGMLLIAGHNRMPARTANGARTLSDVLGFRRFITTAETERMQFAEEEGIFAKYLPYAIVFGATKQWAKRFEGLDASSPAMAGMGWYVGPYAFNPVGFSDSMHDFTVRTAGTIVSTPPSASGGSGFGGFSGGGGGGGGGGSW